jgi:hypothetical protein
MPSFQILDSVWRRADSFRAVRTMDNVNPLGRVAGRPQLSAAVRIEIRRPITNFSLPFWRLSLPMASFDPVRLVSMTFIRSQKLSCILLARTEISLHVFAYESSGNKGQETWRDSWPKADTSFEMNRHTFSFHHFVGVFSVSKSYASACRYGSPLFSSFPSQTRVCLQPM